MTFLAGAFFVWALMSNNPPQQRPTDQIDWPAWVQAVMSVVAILATAFVPRWIDAQKKKESADQFLVFAQYLLGRAESLRESMASDSGRRGLEMWGHKAEWKSIADGAMELSLEILPVAAYLPIWLELREMAVRIAEYHDGAIKYTDSRNDDPDDHVILDGYIYRTKNLYNELIQLDLKHRGYRGYRLVHVED
ncbi:hypothetical protein [Stenotrophomonas maltophilia]|uniref:hypothetical protein n=1 Tax=Stenotrophomonas maltophilia TaxID=40324 RepID=UPI0039C04665